MSWMDSDNNNDRTVRKSYTVPEKLTKIFESKIYERDSTPSNFIAGLMRREVAFEFPLSDLGYVITPAPCFQALIERLKPEDLEEVAREQATRNFGALLLSLDGQATDLQSIIEKYYKVFGKYSGWYKFSHSITKNGLKLVFRHTKGIKWSRYIAEYNHVILDKICAKIDCHVDNNAVVFELVLDQKLTLSH